MAFAVFAALLTITPGLDTLLVLRVAATSGRRAGVAAAAGIALGCLAWAGASAVGLTALLAASRLAFDIVRVAGAAYLCWLGARSLWSLRRAGRRAGPADVESRPAVESRPTVERQEQVESRPWSAWRALRTGLTTNLLNPKVGVFYLSVLPQFLPPGLHPLAGSLLLAVIHDLQGLLWLTALALLVHRARGWFTRAAVRRRFEQVTAAVFIALGLRLALDRTI